MLNEYVLYEKYLNVLREVGEQQITKAKARILSDEISAIEAAIHEADTFISLKLCRPDWKQIEACCENLFNIQKETFLLVQMLRQTYGQLFDYSQAWRKARLEKICGENNLPLPKESER